jgi:hypothetical protein
VLSLLPPAGSCSTPELKMHSLSPGSLCACGHPHTTSSRGVVCSWLIRDQISGSCNTA